LPRICHYFQIV